MALYTSFYYNYLNIPQNPSFSDSLCLEWNSLGLDSTRFAMLADGLAANNNLEMLDLRNNQLSHDCAADLSSALQRNTTLKALGMLSRCFFNPLDFKGVLYLLPKINMFCALSQNNQHLLEIQHMHLIVNCSMNLQIALKF